MDILRTALVRQGPVDSATAHAIVAADPFIRQLAGSTRFTLTRDSAWESGVGCPPPSLPGQGPGAMDGDILTLTFATPVDAADDTAFPVLSYHSDPPERTVFYEGATGITRLTVRVVLPLRAVVGVEIVGAASTRPDRDRNPTYPSSGE